MTVAEAVSTQSRPSGSGGQAWRLAAIGVFLGLPLLLGAVVGLNLVAASDSTETAERAEETARTIVRQVERAHARPQDVAALPSIYLASPSASLARAELQAMAARLVEAAGGHLIETQSGEGNEPDTSGRVAVQLTLDVTNPGLLDLLYGLETNVPLLMVPDLDVRAAGETEGKGEPSGTLRVTMTVAGAWKASAP